jgi:hypothetical protein
MKTMDLFKDILPAIQKTKKDLSNEPDFEKSYDAFMVNRALSYHVDSILHANEMNLRHGLDEKLQFQYYLNSIRSMKRKFQPWVKKEKNDILDAIKEYYQCSSAKALEAMRILSSDQVDHIITITKKGGVGNVERRRHGGGDAKRA